MQTAAHPETAELVRRSDQLTTAFRTLIAASRLSGLGPIEVARELGVDKTLVSRLMTALRATDPLEALSALPGTAPLRQFVLAARAYGAGAGAARAAEAELRAFERELQRSFGTRTRLDAVIADALPQARRRHQESARQAVYRGMALIKGVSIDLTSVTWIVHPSLADPGVVDITVLAGFVGVRRLRPTARVRLGSSHKATRPDRRAELLRGFCRPAELSIESSSDGVHTFYEIASGPVRRDSSADVFLTETLRGAAPRTGPPDRARAYGALVLYASRTLSLNVLVHDSVWPGFGFSARAYDTAGRGVVSLPDPSRDPDRIELDLTLTRGRGGDDELALTPVPRHAEMIRELTAPLGIAGAECRMFTCATLYPPYGSQVMLLCEPPEGARGQAG